MITISNEYYKLPHGWIWKSIHDVCEVILGQSPPSSTYNVIGVGLPFYQGKAEFGALFPTPVKWCTSPKKIAEPGDVLISVRAPVGSTNLCREKSSIGRGLAALRPYSQISTLYLLYYLRFIEKEWDHKATGTTFKAISGDVLKEQRIPLPPLPEQRRIIAKIEELFTQLDAGVAALERTRSLLRRYRQAVLKAAVTGELTREWREVHKDEIEPAGKLLERFLTMRGGKWIIEAAKNREIIDINKDPSGTYKDLPEIPSSWVWIRAELVSDFITKGTTPSANMLYQEGEIPFIKVNNLTFSGELDFYSNPTFIDKETHQGILARSKVVPGDVLMNIVGPPLGKVSIVPDAYSEWNINQAIARFRPLDGYSNVFLSITLQSSPILNWAMKHSKATAGQFNLTLQICRDLPLPLPPYKEQLEIVLRVEQELSIIDEVEKVVKRNLIYSSNLRQSILTQAFSGKLVPQEPEGEPGPDDAIVVSIAEAGPDAVQLSFHQDRRSQA